MNWPDPVAPQVNAALAALPEIVQKAIADSIDRTAKIARDDDDAPYVGNTVDCATAAPDPFAK